MMAAWAYLSLAGHYFMFFIFLFGNRLFRAARHVVWLINGVQSEIDRGKSSSQYQKSAHVMCIVYYHYLDFAMLTTINNFVLIHHRFVSPEYVLRDDVTFLHITSQEAVFVQRKRNSPPPHTFSFFNVGQLHAPEYIITMPLESLATLTETMPKHNPKLLFIQNQARCGGTLLTNIFRSSGRCVTLSEPHVLAGVCYQYYVKKAWDRETFKVMLKRVILVLCKPYSILREEPLAYVIKPICYDIAATSLIQEVFPDCAQLFIYRNPVKVTISLRRAIEAIHSFKLMSYAPNFPGMSAWVLRLLGQIDNGFQNWTPKRHVDLLWAYRLASLTIMHYLNSRKEGVNIRAIRYEQLMSNPNVLLREVFSHCDLPETLIPEALTALKHDSQDDSAIRRENVQQLMPGLETLPQTFFDEAKLIADELEVPGPDDWDGFLLPGGFDAAF